jgi:hypothetical protein
MTKLNKPVVRESGIFDQGSEILVGLDPKLGYTLHYKRQRKVWSVSIPDFLKAVKRRDQRAVLIFERVK